MKIRKNILIAFFIISYLFVFEGIILSNDNQIEIGIDEKLGAILPGDAVFQTSEGDTVLFKDVVNMPVLLALVYFECPGICNPLQTELGTTITQSDLIPGKDYKIVSVSFDHHETPEIAAKWKENYLKLLNGKISADSWIFLTGDSMNIKKITDVAGFYFKPDDKEFVHAGTVITISPERKISRYIFGTTFNPFDLKMALLEAKAGKTNPTIAKVLQFCFSYDPSGRKYTLNVTRIVGTIMLLGIGAIAFVLLRKKKSDKDKGASANV